MKTTSAPAAKRYRGTGLRRLTARWTQKNRLHAAAIAEMAMAQCSTLLEIP
jgi:hypothetical protein